MKKFKEFVKEEGAAPAMSMGTGGVQGLGSAQGTPVAGYDKLMMGGKVLRRKPQMTGLKNVLINRKK
jgi:hypothetical protein